MDPKKLILIEKDDSLIKELKKIFEDKTSKCNFQ